MLFSLSQWDDVMSSMMDIRRLFFSPGKNASCLVFANETLNQDPGEISSYLHI